MSFWRKFVFFICGLLIFVAFDLSAHSEKTYEAEPRLIETSDEESSVEQNDRILTKITFSGNRRTNSFYLNSRLKKFMNRPLSQIDMQEFEGILQMEGLFETISIDLKNVSDTEAHISVTVKEKITFIPLPFIMYSDSSFTGGFMVMDMNVLGIHDMGVIGGVYNTDFLMGVISYIHTPKIEGFPGFSVFASISKDKNEYDSSDGIPFQQYHGTTFNAAFSLMEKIGEHHSISAGIAYSRLKNDDYVKGTDDSKFASTSILSPTAGLSYSATNWNGTFLNTTSAGISGRFNFREQNNKSFKIDYSFNKQMTLTDSVRLISGLSGAYGRWNHISQQSGKGDGLSTILPLYYKTEEIYGGLMGLEWAAFKTKIGLFSMYTHFEAACTYDDYAETDDYVWVYGPACGTKLYLSKIAFPAMAVGLSYNIPQNKWYFAASLGVSM